MRELQEKGSWDNAWFNPENKFDWSAVDRFEIVAEQKALTGIQFFFDDIEVSGEEIPEVLDAEGRKTIMDVRIYPNPISTDSKIEFFLHKPEITDVAIYNSQGQHVKTLMKERAAAVSIRSIGMVRMITGKQPLQGCILYEFAQKP